ncbi:MAG: 50S ribosomal protein L31e [Candidatus Micrarchaeota archaeon]
MVDNDKQDLKGKTHQEVAPFVHDHPHTQEKPHDVEPDHAHSRHIHEGVKETNYEAKHEGKKDATETKTEAKSEAKPVAAKEPVAAKAKLEAKKEDKKAELVLKRIVIIPLADAYAKPAKKRAAKAIKMMREYGARHSKSPIASVKIDSKLASFVNARGSKKPPKKLKVLLTKDKQGNVKLAPA